MKITIGKLEREIDVPTHTFPQNVQEFIYEYGLRQIFNDCHSDVTAKDHAFDGVWSAEGIALIEKAIAEKIEAFAKGEIRTVTRGPRVDAVTTELRRGLVDKLRATGVKKAEADRLVVHPKLAIEAWLKARNVPFTPEGIGRVLEKLTADAQKIVDARKNAASEIDGLLA